MNHRTYGKSVGQRRRSGLVHVHLLMLVSFFIFVYFLGQVNYLVRVNNAVKFEVNLKLLNLCPYERKTFIQSLF